MYSIELKSLNITAGKHDCSVAGWNILSRIIILKSVSPVAENETETSTVGEKLIKSVLQSSGFSEW